MKNLWAPWRMQYILGPKCHDGCVLCAPEDPALDEERLIVYRSGHVFVMLNRYPYASGSSDGDTVSSCQRHHGAFCGGSCRSDGGDAAELSRVAGAESSSGHQRGVESWGSRGSGHRHCTCTCM